MMPDMNEIIGENIEETLKEKGRSVDELAEILNMPIGETRRMLWGGQVINATILNEITVYLGVEREKLVQIPSNIKERDIVGRLAERVDSANGKQAVNYADEISDMILFHRRARRNGEKMMQMEE